VLYLQEREERYHQYTYERLHEKGTIDLQARNGIYISGHYADGFAAKSQRSRQPDYIVERPSVVDILPY